MRQPDRIVRLKTVLARTGLSRSTIYRKIAEGTFPPQIKISINGHLSRHEFEYDVPMKDAEELLALAVVRPEVQRVIDRLGTVPVDIAPRFVTAERLLAQY